MTLDGLLCNSRIIIVIISSLLPPRQARASKLAIFVVDGKRVNENYCAVYGNVEKRLGITASSPIIDSEQYIYLIIEEIYNLGNLS